MKDDAKPYTMDDVQAWVEMRWGRERLDERTMSRIRATVEERDALRAQVEAARTHSSFSSAPCPLCTYRDGKFIASCKPHEEADELRAQVARLTSTVPGLAESGPYTMADVERIEAHRGKPYTRLRATVEQVERVQKERDELQCRLDGVMEQCWLWLEGK